MANSQRPKRRPRTNSPRHVRTLRCEHLEDRRMLAVVTVDTVEDVVDLNDGRTSLREAIFATNTVPGADEINFDFGIDGPATILLTQGELQITDSLTINGDGAALLKIDAGNGEDNEFGTGDGFRIFSVNDGDDATQIEVTISGVTLTGSDYRSGFSNGGGGAIYNREQLTLLQSEVSANYATYGGGITNHHGTLEVNESLLSGNVAGRSGGGIFNYYGDTRVVVSELSMNTAWDRRTGGGGIGNFRGMVYVSRSTIAENSAGSGGGIESVGSIIVDSSTISKNRAYSHGGGIRAGGVVTITRSTITGNSARFIGGGIRAGGAVTLNGSIIANSPSGQDVAIGGNSALTGSHNLIEDGSGSLPFTITGDPLLGPLADNGGPTLTHALLPGSIAINRGDPTIAFHTLDNDQRGPGFLRVRQGRIDLGAVESDLTPPALPSEFELVVSTTELGFDGDYSAGNLTLDEAIAVANLTESPNEITFDPSVFATPQTILLARQLPAIINPLKITGPGAALLTIDAGNGEDNEFGTFDGFRIFSINDGDDATQIEVTISGLTLTGGDTNFTDNERGGGGIWNSEHLALSRISLVANSGSIAGGGIYNAGTLHVKASTLSGNSAFNGGRGGGIYNLGVVSVTDSTFSGNSARDGGGIFNRFPARDADAIFDSRLATITHSTFTGNSAIDYGGGINNLGMATVTQSTFTGNSAGRNGGGISSTRGIVTLNGNIIANSPLGDDVSSSFGGILTGKQNLIEDGSGGLPDTITGDPLLGPLADNGGPTLTHALLPGSPAINVGDLNAVAGENGVPAFDQRGEGFDRIVSRIDIGAYEVQEPGDMNLLVDTLEDESDGEFSRGDLSLREAIELANANPAPDTISFDPSLSGGTILLTQGELQITDSLTINGDGAALLTIDAGNGDDNEFGTGDGFRIFSINDGDDETQIEVTIAGVTLTGGDIGGVSASSGGAIFNSENLTLLRSEVSGNYALGGGGINNYRGTLEVNQSKLSGNGGGGISTYRGIVHVVSSALLRNTTLGGLRVGGGGITNFRGMVTVSSSTIAENSTGSGGGIQNWYGSAIIDESTISNNSANITGGAIYNSEGTVTVTGSTLSGNTARFGGGIYHDQGATIVDGSTISNNSAFVLGGGIYTHEGTVNVTSSTVSGNDARGGGGIFNREGSTIAEGSTISNNSASEEGGGIHNTVGTITVTSSTLYGNSSPDGGGIISSSAATTIVSGSIIANSPAGGDLVGDVSGGHNLIEDGSGGLPDTITGDPLLGPLADNGGPTLTHALLPGSPAINAGDLNAVVGENGVPAFDQRGSGFDRIVSRIDIGAYEVQEPGDMNLLVDTLEDESDGDFSRGDLSLREAIDLANANPVPDTIGFDPGLNGGTILLTQGELQITDALTINGPGAELLTIDASGNDPTPEENNGDGSRILLINDGDNVQEIEVVLQGLTLAGGDLGRDSLVGRGGAIYNFEDLTLTASVVAHNFAANSGGGIYSSNGVLTITGSVLHSNTAESTGGAVSIENGRAMVADSAVRDNSAAIFGGGIHVSRSVIEVTNSSLYGNSSFSGGGVHTSSAAVSTNNTTISGNLASQRGGGISTAGFSRTNIVSTTIANNMARSGGGIANGSPNAITSIASSIIAANIATASHPDIEVMSGRVLGSSNLVGVGNDRIEMQDGTNGNHVGTLDRPIDPLLGPLTDNGGPTDTHALLPGSPAINAGSLNVVAGENGFLLFDQRGEGFDRVVSRIDIGAYEVQTLGDMKLVVDTLLDESDGNFRQTDLSLREAIELANANPVPDTISFDPSLNGGTILLTQGELQITDALTINGPGAELLTIDASGNDPTPDSTYEDGDDTNDHDGSSVFRVHDGVSREYSQVSVLDLILTGGDDRAGAIDSAEDLFLQRVSIVANSGGGVKSDGTLEIDNSLITENSGSGIEARRQLILRDSTVVTNTVFGVDSDGTTTVVNSSVSRNGRSGLVAAGTLLVLGSTVSENSDIGISALYSSTVIRNSVISGHTSEGSLGGLHLSGNVYISNTMITNNSALRGGGGIYLGGGTTEIRDSTIAGNSIQDDDGGGIRIHGGVVTIISSTITGNSSSLRGGGIYLRVGELQIEDSVISNNDTGKFGGGVFSSGRTTISSSTITNNTAGLSGGGVSLQTEATISDSLIFGNSALIGGGVRVYADTRSQQVAITDSTMAENNAGEDGGAIVSYSPLEIKGSTISANEAGRNGGGIYLLSRNRFQLPVVLTNSTVSGNKAGSHGGGIYLGSRRNRPQPPLSLTNSTVSGNVANGSGGGIAGPGSKTISFSTITGNIADADGDGDGAGGGITEGLITLDHAIVSGNVDRSSTANDIAGIFDSTRSLIGLGAEFLGPLQDNGGPTPTHALLPGSPAIDAGDVNLVPGENSVPVFDQRDNPYQRVHGSRIDIGAFEFQPIPGDFDNDGDADGDDLAEWDGGYGSLTSGADFLNWQRTFGDQVSTGAAASADAGQAINGTAARDLALAATLSLNDAPETTARGPVARRNAYSEATEIANRQFATPAPPRRELNNAANSRDGAVENSNDVALDVAFDEFFPAI